jgi:hypothetical protein
VNLYLFRGITKTITKPPLQLLFGDRSFAKINLVGDRITMSQNIPKLAS